MKLLPRNQDYQFDKKRNYKLITPCCSKSNTDGKFTSFADVPEIYGYCHSCGISNYPPTIYQCESGDEFIWNKSSEKFEPIIQSPKLSQSTFPKAIPNSSVEIKYIPEKNVWKYFNVLPENNLLQYLRKIYGDKKVNDAKETFLLGTSEDGGCIFWSVNSQLQVQKSKISYYDANGRRTRTFRVPYKNSDGYYNCLFGCQHIYEEVKGRDIVILVESEKTAIVGYINLPQYVWVAYGGINGLTPSKLQPLVGHTVLIIPDMSENAVNIIYQKIPEMIEMGINAKIWDMTNGRTDEELKKQNIYNNDLEDVIRNLL